MLQKKIQNLRKNTCLGAEDQRISRRSKKCLQETKRENRILSDAALMFKHDTNGVEETNGILSDILSTWLSQRGRKSRFRSWFKSPLMKPVSVNQK